MQNHIVAHPWWDLAARMVWYIHQARHRRCGRARQDTTLANREPRSGRHSLEVRGISRCRAIQVTARPKSIAVADLFKLQVVGRVTSIDGLSLLIVKVIKRKLPSTLTDGELAYGFVRRIRVKTPIRVLLLSYRRCGP